MSRPSSSSSSSRSSSSSSSSTTLCGASSLRDAAVAAATATATAARRAERAAATTATTAHSPALPTLANYTRHERVFAPLSPHDRRVRRRQHVRHFAAAHTRWCSSVRDEQHPFPQRAHTHTTACYRGVDVVATHFPATVAHTSSLLRQQQQQQQQPPLPLPRSLRVAHRYRFTCDALDDSQRAVPLSYLARTLIDDHAPSKLARQRGWCASTALDGQRRNRHVAAPHDCNYVALNKQTRHTLPRHTSAAAATDATATDTTTIAHDKAAMRRDGDVPSSQQPLPVRAHDTTTLAYQPPWERVRSVNEAQRRTRAQRAAAAAVTELTLYTRDDVPATLTMRNKQQWLRLDPVQVTREQLRRKAELRSNPFVTHV